MLPVKAVGQNDMLFGIDSQVTLIWTGSLVHLKGRVRIFSQNLHYELQ